MSKISLVFLVIGLMSTNVIYAADPAVGKQKSATCAACHGADGNSANPLWPNLAGQHAAYLEKQMKEFRDGKRQDPLMTPMAAALSDSDIADIAAYFAAQKQK